MAHWEHGCLRHRRARYGLLSATVAVLHLLLVADLVPRAGAAAAIMRVDTSNLLRRWDGIGGLSAGASSRLLYDYPDASRSDILDMLFAPRVGWGYQILKMELGGDCQSTWGTESSYAHSATDLGWERGYEMWLAKEAKKRNPKIALASLSWCVPGWVPGGFISSADVDYHVNYVKGVKLHHNLTLDYVGVFNERQSTPSYIIALRAALDAAGFKTTKLVASDLGNFGIYNEMVVNQTLDAAVDVIGVHHMHSAVHPADATGDYATPLGALTLPPSPRDPGRRHRALWSSEDGLPGIDNVQPNWDGAKTYAAFLFANLRLKGQSATILCPAINSWMPNIGETLHGFIWAHEPYSGHYTVGAGLWVGAHWTHHTERGWWYVGGGSFAHSGRAPPPPPPPPLHPGVRTCRFRRLHTNAYCANDHRGFHIIKGLNEQDCAAACAKLASCSVFEFGCSGNQDCILLGTCEGPARTSSCGTNVDVLMNSTSCPLLPPQPQPDLAEAWDLNGSWVAFTPGRTNTTATVTILAETVYALRPQVVQILLPPGVVAAGQKLHVFLTCLNESCAGFPHKLHASESPVPVDPNGATISVVLQPSAVYTFTTLEHDDPPPARPVSPKKRSIFYNSSASIFKSSFDSQWVQMPGKGITNFFGNFEISEANQLRQTSTVPPWPWSTGRPDGFPQAIFGTNMQNYAVHATVSLPAGAFARVCGRVGTFHGGFEHMTSWDAPPGVCLTLHANRTWVVGGYSASGAPNVTISSGTMPAAGTSVWTSLSISFEDYGVIASVGEKQVVDSLPLQADMLGSATGCAAIGSSWHAVVFDNVSITATRPIPGQANQPPLTMPHSSTSGGGGSSDGGTSSFLHELLLLDYTLVMPPAGAIQVGFVLVVHETARDIPIIALGRFRTAQKDETGLGRGVNHSRSLSIFDAATPVKLVAGCQTNDQSQADLLGFVNCEIASLKPVLLLAGHTYYIVSEEQAKDGYYAVTRPGWSISSGYRSLIDYDRDAATVVGSVTQYKDARGWVETSVADTMGVALNLHFGETPGL